MRRIQIYDTTLRDGSQGEGVSFSLQDKLLITQHLDSLGIDFIEGGYPLSNEKDAQYFQRVQELDLQHAFVCAFGMTRRRGVAASADPGMRALLESGAAVITLVGKTWDLHVTEVLRVSLEENLAMIADSVRYLREAGRHVIYDAEHFFDGFKANPEYALKTLRTAMEADANLLVLCDTNGGTMPEDISNSVSRLDPQVRLWRGETGSATSPQEITSGVRAALENLQFPVGIHCHNDCDLAVANSLEAVDAGAIHVQGTINGIGERCGNADLISVVANLALKKGYEMLHPGAIEHLTDISRFVYELANMSYRHNQPFVGQSAFAHKGGMHVHAVNRNTTSYEHINPKLVGNERRFLLSELSGRGNIVALAAKHRIAIDDRTMRDILDLIVSLEHNGYQFESADGSVDLLVRRCAGTFRPHFERFGYDVNVETDAAGNVTTKAIVKIAVQGDVRLEVAEGDGPVNALDRALRKALNGEFPNLRAMQLVDYKVRVINSDAGTAARVRVTIESKDEQDVWGTVGVHENVIEASWMALVDSLEYKLYKDESAVTQEVEAATAS